MEQTELFHGNFRTNTDARHLIHNPQIEFTIRFEDGIYRP